MENGFKLGSGKHFVPGLATLKRIADCTGADIENLIKMLDGDESVIVNHVAASTGKITELTEQEILIINKYRQLDADSQEDVEDYIAMKLAKAQRKAKEATTAEEKEEALG